MKHMKQTVAAGLVLGSLGLVGCTGDDEAPRNTHYVAAETALKQSCGSSLNVCHGLGGGLAGFDIGAAIASGDMRSAMVGQPACEYNLMNRVEPGMPDESWMMVKITGHIVSEADANPPATAYGDLIFTPDPSWNESMKCNSSIRGFGQRMPQVAPFEIEAEPLAAIRNWIEMGAPGPHDM